jgi:hypothetical protein
VNEITVLLCFTLGVNTVSESESLKFQITVIINPCHKQDIWFHFAVCLLYLSNFILYFNLARCIDVWNKLKCSSISSRL